MKHLLILILVAICGCAHRPVPVEARHPIVADDIDVMIGECREIVAPAGSATAGSIWIEYAVTYTNKSARPVWIDGYLEPFPFSGIETRVDEGGEWQDYGLGYCGTGAREFEIAPNASHAFTVSLPEGYVGQEFRVLVPYRKAQDSRQWVQAASQPRKVTRPTTG